MSDSGSGLAILSGGTLLFSCLIAIASIVFSVVIFWKIFSKAGYSGAMSLLMFVPIGNLIALCILAFGNWPMLQELNYLRQQVGSRPGAPMGPAGYPQQPYPQQYPQNPPY